MWVQYFRRWADGHPRGDAKGKSEAGPRLRDDFVWFDMQVCWRLLVLIHSVYLLSDSRRLAKRDWGMIYGAIEEHAGHALSEARNEIAKGAQGANHSLQRGTALLYSGVLFPELAHASDWIDAGRTILQWQMREIGDSYSLDARADLQTVARLFPLSAPKSRASIHFQDSAFAVLRNARFDLYVDAMKLREDHQHIGRPNLLLYADGLPLLVDSGCCNYDWLIQEQYLRGERRVILQADRLRILDRLLSEDEVDCQQLFHLPLTNVALREEGKAVVLRHAGQDVKIEHREPGCRFALQYRPAVDERNTVSISPTLVSAARGRECRFEVLLTLAPAVATARQGQTQRRIWPNA